MHKLRVFLADDHPLVLKGLKTVLSAEPDIEVVGEATDGQTAWQEARALQPHVVVMDLSMPGLNGVRATERLKEVCPEVKVVALTVHEDRSHVRKLLQVGASGYVLKRSGAEELLQAIRSAAAGGVYLDSSLTADVVSRFVHGRARPEFGAEDDLSEREAEVLRRIAQGYSNKEIAAHLDLSVKSVETYKARSMEKLGLDSRVDIVRYALQRGWLQGM